MSASVQSVKAWAAVSPEGRIDGETTSYTKLRLTSQMVAMGWRVIRVRIVPVEDEHV